MFKVKKLIFVSPKSLYIPTSIRNHLKISKISYTETDDLQESLRVADVVYQTRVQKERFKSLKNYQKYKVHLKIDKKNITLMKKNAILMHPLPRVGEIAKDVDSDKRAIYFEQAHNGLYVRMALLSFLFDKSS